MLPDESMFRTSPVITRYPDIILQASDIPYDATLTFNAGVVREGDHYVMLFRNDYGCDEAGWQRGERFKGTNIGLAYSKDGIKWDVEPEPVLEWHDDEIYRIYDPRITVADDCYYVNAAVDTKHGIRAAILRTHDFRHYETISLSVPDNRNNVIFPEKINGKFVRLERPMPVYSRDRDQFDIWLSESPDLVYWGNSRLVLACEDVPFCNDKIGPGAPPLKTKDGWLVIFHSVDIDPNRGKDGWEAFWRKRYVIGIMLLDLNDPSKVIGMSKVPLMVPETDNELKGGFRNNALFPCGMVDQGDGIARIYYSVRDQAVCMATAKISDLVAICSEKRK